jgi:glycerol-3-phosphate acyltransferase PlsX
MKIVLDVFGGDHSPDEIVKGALQAVKCESGFKVVLVGRADVIIGLLAKESCDIDRFEIVDACDVITNDDAPTEAIRRKKNSSLVKCFNVLNSDSDAVALVSAGSTGAVLTGAVLLVKRLKGISRPALAPILPTVSGGHVVLVDCGANVDSKAQNLVQFAFMGAMYAKAFLGIQNAKIGLLSNGVEEGKGNDLNKEAYPPLKESGLNFAGNLEARDILFGGYDVIVSDGFSGNIALKACEGTALAMFDIIKKNILAGGLRAKLGYLLLKPALKNVKKELDYSEQGGAVLLGLEKLIVKSHGSSKAKSIKASVLQAVKLHKSNVINEIKLITDN